MSNNNEWDFPTTGEVIYSDSANGKEESIIFDELSKVQKAQIANYVAAAVNGYLIKDRKIIAQLQEDNGIIKNALNILLGCLETGIPVKDGKVTLGPEQMRVLTTPQQSN